MRWHAWKWSLVSVLVGLAIGFLVERVQRSAAGLDSAFPHALPVATVQNSRAGSSSSGSIIAGVPLFDRYQAVLAQIENATDNNEMFRIFDACRPDHSLRRLVAEHWASMDSPGMFDRLRRAGVWQFDHSIYPLFRIWAQTDPEAAMAAIRSFENEHSRGYLVAALPGWISVDPEAALNSELRGAGTKHYQTKDTWKWIEEDPEGAFQLLLRVKGSGARDEGFEKVVPLLINGDPVGALKDLEDLHWRDRASISQLILKEWGKEDLESAISWADENFFGARRTSALSELYGQAVDADPAGAVALLDDLGGGALREKVAERIAWTWAREDPRAAIAWANDELDNKPREMVLATWLNQDDQATADWIVESGAQDVSWEMLRRVASKLAWNKRDAVGWIGQLPIEKRAYPLSMLVLSYEAPETKVQELLGNLPGNEREDLLSQMGMYINRYNPKAAKSWISTLSAEDQVIASRNMTDS